MRFVPEVLYGSLVLEHLLAVEMITKDHYDEAWAMFKDIADPVNYILIDLSQVLTERDDYNQDDAINYIIKAERLQDYHNTKLAI